MRHPVRAVEVFGLEPLGPALEQMREAIFGRGEHVPPTEWGLSSLAIFKPRVSLPTWLGKNPGGDRVVVYQLPNRSRPPRDAPFSVEVVGVEDFRGRAMTYRSHPGTDFSVPVGTEVVAAAPGIVRLVRNDMQRGGLKVCIDHGAGLITTSNHLSRALVEGGERVARGQVIGLSGMSGVDGVLFFPWLAPHLHFNVLLDGEAVDPWAAPGEISLWRAGARPEPHVGSTGDEELEPTEWSATGVTAAIEACRDPELVDRLFEASTFDQQAAEVALARLFKGPSFSAFPALVDEPTPRVPLLDLPFSGQDFRGAVFADEL